MYNSNDRKSNSGKNRSGGSDKKYSSSKSSGGKKEGDKPAFKKRFEKREDGSVIKPKYKKRDSDLGSQKGEGKFSRFSGDKKRDSNFDKPKRENSYENKRNEDRPKRSGSPFHKKEGDSYSKSEKRPYKPGNSSFSKKYGDSSRSASGDSKNEKNSYNDKTKHRKSKRSFETREQNSESFGKQAEKEKHHDSSHKKHKSEHHHKEHSPKKESDGLTRLNKYLSNAGICSRREADELIKAGVVSVNGKVITEMGFKVKADDTVNYDGAVLKHERKVYLMLNKPKDYITTAADTHDRHTVMELIAGACKERVYPVGRLDRNTTGLLLFTNDGDMATKLMHPKFGIKKVYNVGLDKNLKPDDFKKLEEGFELEDGFIKPDAAAYVEGSKREIGIEIHSGRNRIVRRVFEYLGYDVIKLDRVTYAGLTKKDLGRGKWRFLTAKEISFLKMVG